MGSGQTKSATVSSSPYSRETTSEEIMKEFGQRATGKYFVVTGANVGLGFETARQLAKHGAHVTICCRNVQAGEEAANKIRQETSGADVDVRRLDLGDLKTVREFVRVYRETGKPLHVLVNNAGVMACPKSFTADGFEMQFGVNHIGHFFLTKELLPILQRSGTRQEPARVVNLSSMGQRLFAPPEGIPMDDLRAEKHYSVWCRYGVSKLANVLFSNELNRRMIEQGQPVISVALHPGAIMETNLIRHYNSFGHFVDNIAAANGWGAVWHMLSTKMKTTSQGTATTLYCALAPDVIPGEYYSDCHVDDYLHPKARDEHLARQLWEVSEQLVRGK